MTDYSITVLAGSEEEAISLAAMQLGEGPLTAIPSGDNIYVVSVASSDAGLMLQVSDDAMTAIVVAANPSTGNGRRFDEAFVADALKVYNIKSEMLVLEPAWLVAQVNAGAALGHPVIARGTPPVNGVDAQVSCYFAKAAIVGSVDCDGNLDYHERAFVEIVHKHQLLAEITPETSGVDGWNVYGDRVAAVLGKPALFSPDENVYLSNDGHDVHASKDGMIKYINSILSVTDMFEYQGSIGLETGNIHMDKGSVVVHGGVMSGFEVAAQDNIQIEDNVHDAVLNAGGDIALRNGCIKSTVSAHGCIHVKFAQGSTLEAGDNLMIYDNIIHCNTHVGGAIFALKGNGAIRGGHLRCGRRVEVRDLGSPNGHNTIIELGVPGRDERLLLKERGRIVDKLRHIDGLVGNIDSLYRAESSVRTNLAQFRKLQTEVNALQRDYVRVSSQINNYREQREHPARLRLKVHGTVYPGTTIVIRGSSFLVNDAMFRCTFFYDPERQEIAVVQGWVGNSSPSEAKPF